jgi:DnaJ-class molecular chaperone
VFFFYTTLIELKKKTNNTFSVRRAYRKRALETHPDKLDPTASEAEKQDAEQQFHKVKSVFFSFYVFIKFFA